MPRGDFISGAEAERIARADLQTYGGLTDEEMSDFTTKSDEVEDWSFKKRGISWRVCSTYDAHHGLPDLHLTHFISATDGKVICREDSAFQDGEDFARYYRSLAACSKFLYAQEALEETDGSFRMLPDARQQAIYAQYGNYNVFLSEQHYPCP